MAKLLVADDDDSLVSMLVMNIKQEGYTVDVAYNFSSAVEILGDTSFDLLILDVDLPDGSGFDLCAKYRKMSGRGSVLMLTGHHEIEAKEKAFGCGADDYLTKPFDFRELSVRIKALLRRSPLVASNVISLGRVRVDLANRAVSREGQAVHLNRLDFNLLEFFLKHPNTVLAQERILNSVWSSYTESGTEALRASIKRVRKEIDTPDQSSLIETVYGVGYKLRLE